jgi:hypothetical protein
LIITPLIKADTDAGAIGWARGSQLCSGITPAFVPIPTQDRDPGARAGDVRDRDVEEDRASRSVVGAADEDQRRRQQRHELPTREERQRVTRA